MRMKTTDLSEGYSQYDKISNDAYKIASRAWGILNRDTMTYEDVMWAITFIFGDYQPMKADPNSWRQYTLEYVELFKQNGIKFSRSELEKLIAEDENFVAKVKADFIQAFNYWLHNKVDDIMRGAITAYMRPQREKFSNFSEKFWMQWAGGDGNAEAGETAIILGMKGSGKTDFALTLADIFLRNGWDLATNIKIAKPERPEITKDLERIYDGEVERWLEEKPDEFQEWYELKKRYDNVDRHYHYVTKFSDLLKRLAISAYSNKKTLVVLDELTVGGMRKQKTMSGKNLNMEELQRLTRKMNASMVFIWHYDKDITTDMQMTASAIIRKHGDVLHKDGRTDATVEYRFTKTPMYYEVTGIPPSPLVYETNDLAPFSTDISLSKVIDYITKAEQQSPDRNLYKDMIDYIDEVVENEARKDRD